MLWFVVVVVVQWLICLKEYLLLERLTSAIFSLISVGKMCILFSRPTEILTFWWKNGETPKLLLLFFVNHIPKNMEIVEDFVGKNNNNKPLEIVEDFACEDKNLSNLQRSHICFLHFFIFLFLFFIFSFSSLIFIIIFHSSMFFFFFFL